jgi:diaminopimelate epimerase
MRFEKWQALGNDYLIVEQTEIPFELTPARIRKLCAGHFGVFADGILLLSRSQEPHFVAQLRIYNPDGSEAELSGNGAREAVLYLRRRGWTDQDVFSIQTAAGDIRPTITGPDTCRVDMGHARLTSKDFPSGPGDGRAELLADGRAWSFQHVSIGNPQCAIHVEDLHTLNALDLPAIGAAIEAHELFPNRTNVSWYTEISPPHSAPAGSQSAEGDPARVDETESQTMRRDRGRGDTIRARIFERGVGETLSSGTGATGAAVAHKLRRVALGERNSENGPDGASTMDPHVIAVELDGGELEVEVGEDLQVNLTGWARPVFAGQLSDELIRELTDIDEGAA